MVEELMLSRPLQDASNVGTPKGNILVVDDFPQNLGLLTEILQKDGFEVRPAKSGGLALVSARTIVPDLILLDIMLPEMDGYEVCRQLKQDESTRDVPVIFISALEESVDRVKAFKVGAVGFITKPFQPEEVLACVGTHLTLRKVQSRLEKQKAELEREIAERRKIEQALHESEERLQSILDNAPAVIYVKDIQGRYSLVNRKFEELFHVDRERFVGKKDMDVFSSKVARALRENDLTVLESGRSMQVEEEVNHDQGLRSYLSVKFPLRNLRGEAYAVCGISSDITKRKRVEFALQKSKEAAEAANRAKSIFLANMSHEFRTPLNVILGFSQLLQRDITLTDHSRKHLHTINRSGEHLLGLINDVLEVSKIETGHIILNQMPFDFFGLLDDMESMFQPRAQQKGLSFRVERGTLLPRYLVGDEGKVRQVLINLLGNAVKFTDNGAVTLKVSVVSCLLPYVEKKDPKQWTFLLEVEDTGVGIASQEMGKVFQPFEQALSGQTKGGTGLGLAISREYACLMGGDITASSELGKGSVFSFCCRLQEGCQAATERNDKIRQVVGLAPETAPKKILVVDDRKDSRQFVAELLGLVGFATLEAANGKEAIALFQIEMPDLVLMDMRMPVMDGYEATRRLKATAAGKTTPIIAVSASALIEERENILASGADEFICKPFREHELFAAIGKQLGIAYRYAEPKSSAVQGQEPRKVLSEDLEALPAVLRAELRRALLVLNVSDIRDIIQRIDMINGPLGEGMRRLEREYQFDVLLALVNDSP
ncbi:MAG: response regulator [Trichloromonadaceae bacterium]